MANISALNGNLCTDISAIDGIAFANIGQFDGNPFCPSPTPSPTPTQTPGGVTPTPTPTNTPTPTPTPSACVEDCCLAELCYSERDCADACVCNKSDLFYLHLPCGGGCRLDVADGIFSDDLCTTPADSGYYADSSGCAYWDGSSTLTYNGPC